jgi:ERCC4 domain
MVFRTSGTWPRAKALYCYPVGADEWPTAPEIVERAPLRSCVRRGAAIDLILDRGRENRSQLVFTRARGRDAVFWQSARARKQARPNVTTPTARAAGIAELQVLVDTREQYAYRFATQQATTVKRALPCGDYGIAVDGRLVAAVERKSLADLVSSLINGKLRYAVGDLAALPRAAVIVEDRYSQIFNSTGSGHPSSLTGSLSRRCAGPHCRSPSPRHASSPRNGPTATSRRHTPGPRPSRPSLIASAFQSNPPRRQPRRRPHHRRPPRCAHGHARPAWPCQIAVVCLRTSRKPGVTRTRKGGFQARSRKQPDSFRC